MEDNDTPRRLLLVLHLHSDGRNDDGVAAGVADAAVEDAVLRHSRIQQQQQRRREHHYYQQEDTVNNGMDHRISAAEDMVDNTLWVPWQHVAVVLVVV